MGDWRGRTSGTTPRTRSSPHRNDSLPTDARRQHRRRERPPLRPFPDAPSLARAKRSKVEALIRVTGFYRVKARVLGGVQGSPRPVKAPSPGPSRSSPPSPASAPRPRTAYSSSGTASRRSWSTLTFTASRTGSASSGPALPRRPKPVSARRWTRATGSRSTRSSSSTARTSAARAARAARSARSPTSARPVSLSGTDGALRDRRTGRRGGHRRKQHDRHEGREHQEREHLPRHGVGVRRDDHPEESRDARSTGELDRVEQPDRERDLRAGTSRQECGMTYITA